MIYQESLWINTLLKQRWNEGFEMEIGKLNATVSHCCPDQETAARGCNGHQFKCFAGFWEEKQRKDYWSDRPRDLELFARAISNKIIFASKKAGGLSSSISAKLLMLSLHQVVWPPAIKPQRMICALALKSWMRRAERREGLGKRLCHFLTHFPRP